MELVSISQTIAHEGWITLGDYNKTTTACERLGQHIDDEEFEEFHKTLIVARLLEMHTTSGFFLLGLTMGEEREQKRGISIKCS